MYFIIGYKFVPTCTFMKEENINNYLEQLKTYCPSCPQLNKCKDQNKLCFRKKLVFNIAFRVYKQREKKGKL